MMILAKFSTMENAIYLYNDIIITLDLNLPHKLLTIPNFKCYTLYYEKSIRAKLAVSLQVFSIFHTKLI
jgi:hypothetical protein